MTEVLRDWHVAHGGAGEPLAPTGCLVDSYGDVTAELTAGRQGALLVDRSRCARLQLVGKDGRDLIQRLSTNDVSQVKEGRGLATTFTTEKGRIIDRVTFHAASDGDLLMGSAGQAEALRAWITKYIIREDVQVLDLTEATAQLELMGPKATQVLHAPLLKYAELHELMILDLGGIKALACRTDPVAGLTVRLVVPVGLAPQLMEHLLGRGAVLGGARAYNVLRLEAGLPLHGPELNEHYSPLEAGLVDTLHFGKGCYVGQEVVARMDTYMKQRWFLVAAQVEGAAPAPGTALRLSNGDSGEVTSGAELGDGTARFMAYLKTAAPKVGQTVTVESDPVRTATLVHRPAQAPAPKGGEGNQSAAVV